jgi:hypothetical protein
MTTANSYKSDIKGTVSCNYLFVLYDILIVLCCFGLTGCHYPGLVLFFSRDIKWYLNSLTL